ncbi:hypothetical protein VHEMI03868 [[Torrubiella] hemipterigena]|uniref:Uncharacterized protein n=1 Tax=[Torrubiella] hemipterigena TaxID=1531966 RepID=A0A0A1STR7_9HYPO|nr:hypothetical protein VHEMI03868 [[Torrubiella] hemipterigena]
MASQQIIETSFGVAFVASSIKHQEIMSQIKSMADDDRARKKEEFEKKQALTGAIYSVHDKNCSSCRFHNQATNLTIEIHDWPLPENAAKAANVVFEMQVPEAFRDWREATRYVIVEALRYRHEETPVKVECTLQDYWRKNSLMKPAGTLILASLTKANKKTHRHLKTLATTTENSVLVNHGLSYKYFDSGSQCVVSSFRSSDYVAKACTYKLSEQWVVLQPFLFRPPHEPNGLTPNHATSKQSDKIGKAVQDKTRTEFLAAASEIAHVCVASFDLDNGYLKSILALPEQAATLIEASIIVANASQGMP